MVKYITRSAFVSGFSHAANDSNRNLLSVKVT